MEIKRLLDDIDDLERSTKSLSQDPQVIKRIPKVLQLTFRRVGFELSRNADIVKSNSFIELIRRAIITSLIDSRAFDKARDKREVIELAEKLSEAIYQKFLSLFERRRDLPLLFAEFFIITRTMREKGLPLEIR